MPFHRDMLIAERYILLDEIYKRYFSIWLAHDTKLKRDVAIKLVSDPHSNSILEYEALQMARLEHPYLIPVYDTGLHEGIFYLVMRYISRSSLASLLKSDALSLNVILKLVQQIAESLDYLHSKGHVYGNLKASNIMMDERTIPYLSNFLMASISNLERIQQAKERLLGTMYNLAPEQFVEESSGKAVDIYAFGILLYHCLLGKLPFNGKISLAELQVKDSSVTMPSVQEKYGLPIGIDLILQRLTNPEPQLRYPQASMAVDDLIQVINSRQSSIRGRVFISYATKDKAYVHQVAKELRRLNIDIWIDQDIEKGSDWGDSIESSLKETDMMLLILSEASSISEYVIHEWSFFMGLGKPIYPFVLYSSPPKAIHPRLSRVQQIMGTNDIFTDVSRIIDVLAGGNPSRINADA
jgi:serine/threonine protein kinase